MSDLRRLIVNADDFGLSPGVNDGVIAAHEHGIVTTASLMVHHEAAATAARYARSHPRLGVGLHIDLGEWVFTEGNWESVYERADLEDAIEVEKEVRGQIETFCTLVGGLPTHLDSHQHVHGRDQTGIVIGGIAQELNLPLRNASGHARYCGAFYGQSATGDPAPELITVDALVDIVRSLPTGTTELCCHPASTVDFEATYATERLIELRVLCDDGVRSALVEAGVELTGYGDHGR